MAGVPVAPSPSYDTVRTVFADGSVGRPVRLRGWVHRSRQSGGLLFFVLRDRTGSVQVTAKRDVLGEAAFEAVAKVQLEGSLMLAGTVAEDKRAPGGREVRATEVTVVHAGAPFP